MKRKTYFSKLSALILATGALVFSLSSSLIAYAGEDVLNSTSWMSEVDDERYLSEITIPGTHDSGTQYVELSYFMKCQNTDIKKQLENGFRYLDLRVCFDIAKGEGDHDKLKLVHNFADCHAKGGLFAKDLLYADVMESVYSFLDENPTETVIVNIKIEDDEHTISDIQNFLHQEIVENVDYWYTENRIPTLGEVRGKIVLMTRFDDEAGYDENGLLLKWDEQNNKVPVDIPYELYMTESGRLWVQDRYKYNVQDKYEAVVDGIENCEADENTLFLNFVSTSGDGKVGHPKVYAKQLNKLFLSYDLQSDTSYGIIIVDFGNKKIAKHIYETNF